ncbi:MAG: SsrA-binding protein SmpB [Cytophagales bacterium]
MSKGSSIQQNINIKNRKARYEFEILDKEVAGIVLTGSEIKSIRMGKASLQEGYCFIDKDEMWIKNMHIAEYTEASHANHEPTRKRKLLLKKKEIEKFQKKTEEKGLTIVPLRLFINSRGFAKMEIGLAKGKKIYDKRQDIKNKDMKREIERFG